MNKQPGPKEYLESKIKKLGATEMAGIALRNVSLSINPKKNYYGEPIPVELDRECMGAVNADLDVSNAYPAYITNEWPGSSTTLTFYRNQGKLDMIAQASVLPFNQIEGETLNLQRALLSLCGAMELQPGAIHLHIALATMDWSEALPNASHSYASVGT